MGLQKSLSLEEIGKIKVLSEEGYSLRKIADRIGRSHQVVSNFLKDPEYYGKRFKGRTKLATTNRERRAILREASNSTLSARQIAHNVGTGACIRTVQRILKNCLHLKRLKIMRKPCLKDHHCIERLQFALNKMHWTTEWHQVVFSDEKKFNLDGPDGYSYYFHDLRKNKLILSRRRNDVGAVMVWGAISYNGPVDLVVIKVVPLWVKLQGAKRPLLAGQRTELVCQVAGARPKPSISWWKAGVRLDAVRESTEGNITTSVVSFVPHESDSGRVISCRSVQPSIAHSTREDGRKMEIQYIPIVTLDLGASLNKDTINEGSDVYLDCRIRANPWHTSVYFTHNGTPIKPGPGIIVANQSLVLQKISKEMRGPYVCVAKNTRGEGRSSPLHLDIKYVPSCKTEKITTLRVGRGESFELNCQLDANPMVNITYKWWFNSSIHNRREIVLNKTNNISNNIFQYKITTQSDYGWIQCTGSNTVGDMWNYYGDGTIYGEPRKPCIYQILPADKPSQVQSCDISNITVDTLNVNCTEGKDGGNKQNFLLEVYDTQSKELLTNLSSIQPYFHVQSLPPGVAITINVRSYNNKGFSSPYTITSRTLTIPQRRTSSLPIVVELTPLLVAVAVLTLVIVLVATFIFIAVRCRHGSQNGGKRKVDVNQKSKIVEDETSNVPLTHTKVTESLDSIDKNPDIIPMDSLSRDTSLDYGSMKPLLPRHTAVCCQRENSPQYMCTPMDIRRSEGGYPVPEDRSQNNQYVTRGDWGKYESLVALNPGGLLTTDPLQPRAEYFPQKLPQSSHQVSYYSAGIGTQPSALYSVVGRSQPIYTRSLGYDTSRGIAVPSTRILATPPLSATTVIPPPLNLPNIGLYETNQMQLPNDINATITHNVVL